MFVAEKGQRENNEGQKHHRGERADGATKFVGFGLVQRLLLLLRRGGGAS